MPELRVQSIAKSFDSRAVLRGISFNAGPGDIVAIIGPSGGGKTTLLRCILGEIVPDKGKILIDKQDVTREKVWRRGVGIVYQRYALFSHMTVAKNVGYGLRVRGVPRHKIDRRVEELLELVHLKAKANQYPERLSGGERQRVALARALAVEPKILLLDEAFTALDATTRHRVVREVREIISRLRVTTVLVTHDQEEAFLFSNHVLVLNEGQKVIEGPPDEVMTHRHPFIQDFIKMAVFHKSVVKADSQGRFYVPLEEGNRIPVDIPGLKAGDAVQVMVKKSGDSASIEVWPRAPT